MRLDRWLLYPAEQERLLGMISRRPNTIIISGDSHFAELQCNNTIRGPLFEVHFATFTKSLAQILSRDIGFCGQTERLIQNHYPNPNIGFHPNHNPDLNPNHNPNPRR